MGARSVIKAGYYKMGWTNFTREILGAKDGFTGTAILIRERSEEEKLRRHLYGDKGASFSGGKVPKIDTGGVIGTITTMVTKDLLIIEMYEE